MIEPPTQCPCCSSKLVWKNDLLYCVNPDCGETIYKRIEYFAKTLKIKGLGTATIKKLDIRSIQEIYDLTVEDLTYGLNSEKLAVKLYDEINNSKQQPLNIVLPAFGIPLVGKTAADKLSKVCNSIYDIDYKTCKEAGLGDKTTENLIEWLELNDFYMFLPMNLEFTKTVASSNSIKGVVCISGKLNSYSTKQAAQEELERLGYLVKSSITKDVTILVNESGKETQKTQKARETGVIIVTNLKQFIEEN